MKKKNRMQVDRLNGNCRPLCHTAECSSLSIIIGIPRGTLSFQYSYYKRILTSYRQSYQKTKSLSDRLCLSAGEVYIRFVVKQLLFSSWSRTELSCIMECRRFYSVVSIMEPLPGRRSSTSSPTPSLPVSGKSLSFSISAILGLEYDQKQQDLPTKGEFIFIVPREHRYVITEFSACIKWQAITTPSVVSCLRRRKLLSVIFKVCVFIQYFYVFLFPRLILYLMVKDSHRV